jgi:hypothetical protein
VPSETRPSFVLPFPVGGRISQTAELVDVGLGFNDGDNNIIINITEGWRLRGGSRRGPLLFDGSAPHGTVVVTPMI